MFTGIVEELGTVIDSRPVTTEWGAGVRLRIAASTVLEGSGLGASIAVNGCCLTVIEHSDDWFAFQAGPETLIKTTLGQLHKGSKVNLERALRLSDRLGGHIVQGHIDTTATLVEHRADGPWAFLKFELNPAWTRLMVPKGSIAVDGVSLTVVDTGPGWFTNMLIPHTLAVTTLGLRKVGEPVNIETDILARHVQRLLETSGGEWSPDGIKI